MNLPAALVNIVHNQCVQRDSAWLHCSAQAPAFLTSWVLGAAGVELTQASCLQVGCRVKWFAFTNVAYLVFLFVCRSRANQAAALRHRARFAC